MKEKINVVEAILQAAKSGHIFPLPQCDGFGIKTFNRDLTLKGDYEVKRYGSIKTYSIEIQTDSICDFWSIDDCPEVMDYVWSELQTLYRYNCEYFKRCEEINSSYSC